MNNDDNQYSQREEQLQTLRTIIHNYNMNQRLYNLNQYDFNRNMNMLFQMLDNLYNTNHAYSSPNRNRPPFNNYFQRSFYSPTMNSSNMNPYRYNINNINNMNNMNNINNMNNNYQNIGSRLMQSLLRGLALESNNQNNNSLNEQQISQYTQTIFYTEQLNEPRCPITQENFEEGEEICQIIHCGHYFKKNAIYRWFSRSTNCPVCRYNLLSNINATDINDNALDPSFNNIFFSMYNNDFSDNLVTTSFDYDGSGNSIYSFEFPMYFSSNI